MDYIYSEHYGDPTFVTIQYDAAKGKHVTVRGPKLDAAADKGLLQVMKEDRLTLRQLLAILRRETTQALHRGDASITPAYQRLQLYAGAPGYGTDTTGYRWYWYNQLGVPHPA